MKTQIYIRLTFVMAVFLLVDYIIMVLLGCSTCLFNFGDNFYCGTYCLAGKIILVISALVYTYLMYPDFKLLLKKLNGASTEK